MVGRALGVGCQYLNASSGPPPASSPLVRYHQVCLAYRRHKVLSDFSGDLALGSLTAIVGSNGAGKSTLLRATLGLHPLESGSIQLSLPKRRVAYLAQQSRIDRSFPLSVLDAVLLAYWPAARLWRGVSAAQREQALGALDAAGLGALARRPVAELSSGQFQRMLFVRVQLQEASFIVLDEPFNAVDAQTTEILLEWVLRWHAQGRTVLAVLHDYAQVYRHFPQTILLGGGRLQAWGPSQEVLEQARRLWQPDLSSLPQHA